jgi:dTDP-glucose 4,6-dehydratase
MKVLVTGGAGFIGSHFIRRLLRRAGQFAVVNLDSLTYAGNLRNLADVAADPRYQFVLGDVCDPGTVDEAITRCNAVVHLAAESHVDRSIYDPAPALRTNVNGTFTLLNAARSAGVARFVHVSTDEVYGDIPSGEFAVEGRQLEPNSPYAASKAAADLLVRSFVRTYGFPAVIARPSNNYGPNQFPEKFLPLMIANALDEKSLPIYGHGKQQRNWIHVEDTCSALESILERGQIGETYNIAGPAIEENTSMARHVLKLLGKPESLIQYVEDRPGHDRRYALNTNKIRTRLGWTHSIALSDGLARTIEWYRTNPEWLDEIRRGEYRTYYEKYYANRSSTLESIRRIGPK